MTKSADSTSQPPTTGVPINREQALFLEDHLLRTAYELLKRNFRASQRAIEKDFGALNGLIAEELGKVRGGDDNGQRREEAVRRLGEGVERVKGLKRKLAELLPSSTNPPLLRPRLAHLSQLDSSTHTSDPTFVEYSETRLIRYIADHFIRQGNFDAARTLVESRGITNLVDIDLFRELASITASLKAGSCTEALAWCGENRGSLKKRNSNLEYILRTQEYIELCRSRSILPALAYLRKHLLVEVGPGIPWNDTQRLLGLLVFDPASGKKISQYDTSYHPNRWQGLVHAFDETFHEVYSLPKQSPLLPALSSGLSTFKLPSCNPTATALSTSTPAPASTSLKPLTTPSAIEASSSLSALASSNSVPSSFTAHSNDSARSFMFSIPTSTFDSLNTTRKPAQTQPSTTTPASSHQQHQLPSNHPSCPSCNLSSLTFPPPTLTHPAPSPSSPSTISPLSSHNHNDPTPPSIPFSHQTNSFLLCRITGLPMDDTPGNGPMCFPNGYVYSERALRERIEMAVAEHGPGEEGSGDAEEMVEWVTCPRSGLRVRWYELGRVFVV